LIKAEQKAKLCPNFCGDPFQLPIPLTESASVSKEAVEGCKGVRSMVSLSDSIASDAEPGEVASLVGRAAEGDQTAWNALVDRYAGTVWLIARAHGLGTADAADVSRTTWLRMADHLHRIEAPEQLGAWMATTARRESLRLLRLSGR
jgi:hypothetical protein